MRSSDILDNETGSFIALSRRAGERFDLIQAGGGNTSVKLADGTMLIKSSGYHLSDLSPGHGYTRVDLGAVLRVLDDRPLAAMPDKRQRDAEAAKLLQACVRDSGARPSIETFLHALLDRYTLHTHPLAVNAVACRSDWRDVLARAAGEDAAFVPYGTPGLELALRLKAAVDDHVRLKGGKPRTLFLQNHGLITSADDGEAAMAATDSVLTALEKVIGADLGPYKLTNRISSLINEGGGPPVVSYLSRDSELEQLGRTRRDLFFAPPFCPDGMVYCGPSAVELSSLDDREPVARYRKQYGEAPRVVLYGNRIFFTGLNVRKAREAEEVFKFQVLVLSYAGSSACPLSDEELNYLGNWEAEQYRRKK